MKQLRCLRCDSAMEHMMREFFQKGSSGPWVRDINFKFRGGLELDVYCCKKCGKVEFFLPEQEFKPEEMEVEVLETPDYNEGIAYVSTEGIPQIRCPRCGYAHDFDSPRCPRCEHVY